MPLDFDAVFIQHAIDAIKKNSYKLPKEKKEKFCDELIDLVDKYLPGNFKTFKNEEEK